MTLGGRSNEVCIVFAKGKQVHLSTGTLLMCLQETSHHVSALNDRVHKISSHILVHNFLFSYFLCTSNDILCVGLIFYLQEFVNDYARVKRRVVALEQQQQHPHRQQQHQHQQQQQQQQQQQRAVAIPVPAAAAAAAAPAAPSAAIAIPSAGGRCNATSDADDMMVEGGGASPAGSASLMMTRKRSALALQQQQQQAQQAQVCDFEHILMFAIV